METHRTSFSMDHLRQFCAIRLAVSISELVIPGSTRVNFHKPFYTSPNTCSSCDPSITMRNIYHPFFDQYGVDLVLQGHVHNYQRTFPLKYNPSSNSNPIKTSSSTSNYNDPEGEIFAIVGTGGINFHSLSGKSSFVVSQQDDKFGYLDIVFTNDGATLQGKYYLDSGSISDQFTIDKTIGNSSPVANSQSVAVTKDTSKPVTLTATDSNGDPLTYSVVTPPTHGTLSGTAPSVIYTPQTGYTGPDRLHFQGK